MKYNGGKQAVLPRVLAFCTLCDLVVGIWGALESAILFVYNIYKVCSYSLYRLETDKNRKKSF
jgi:hypothetical protein